MPSLFFLKSAFLHQGVHHSSLCSRSDSPLSRLGAALNHLDSLPPHNSVTWTDGSVSLSFNKGGSGVLANCSLCGTEAILCFSAGPVCLSFSAEACAILQALRWSRQHQQVCDFFSPSLRLSLCPRHSALPSNFPFTTNSLVDRAGIVFSFLLYYQATMDFQTFVSPGNDLADELARRGALLVPL